MYIDGTKIEANANKYSWVWKKSCLTNRDKVFGYITELLRQINEEVLFYYDLKMEPREEYAFVRFFRKKFNFSTFFQRTEEIGSKSEVSDLLPGPYEAFFTAPYFYFRIKCGLAFNPVSG